MKKLLYILFGFLFICNAYAAQIVNVEYIHNLISQEWDITVPYNPALTNVKSIANMKYLLTAVDVANEILNGEKTSNYGNTEFATTRIADTIATNQAVETLVRKIDKGPEFTLTTTPDTNSFLFKISAAGEFVVDWGDGTVETITKADTTDKTYKHNYATAGAYTIGLSGQATAYNTSTSTAAISFSSGTSAVPSKIASIDGSLGAIFGTLSSGTQKQPRFYQTFYNATNMTGSIPSDLFAGISGAPASNMFEGTFASCRGLTSIPENLFAGISGAPAGGMFESTFSGCSGLTSIPENLFAGISGAPASNMFEGTFASCTGLTSIPENLFAGISGAPASYMFGSTFASCRGLTSIPENLFAGISGAPAHYMFGSTFHGCSGLTSIPENLFAGISGAPAHYMFGSTFHGCSGLTGAIPDGLFAGISGAPASYMFYDTFSGCTGLTSIPAGLFAGISGAPANSMFNSTFSGCSKLTSIPENLFAGITGAPASSMFYQTFYNCSGLTSIPENLFGNISGTAQSYMFQQTFFKCTSLTGPSARINGQYLYEIWSSATSSQVGDMYSGATGLSDYTCIPSDWGGAGFYCGPAAPENAEYNFFLTTKSIDVFSFDISAAGEFYIDWGDGKTEWITKSSTSKKRFTHQYTSSGIYTISLGGQATAYNTDETTAAISFYTDFTNVKKIASIDGSLGAIFGTLADGTQPRFYQTFYNATITGAIPSDLFAGISGAPVSYMFAYTFYGCSGLTSIPENLFGNISGPAQSSMFAYTFYKCLSLTGPSARINGQYLYEIWPNATSTQVGGMYRSATKLSDYSSIPSAWK